MERMRFFGFALLHDIVGTLLGVEPKVVPDLDEPTIPANFKMILEDYSKDAMEMLNIQREIEPNA